uniref:NADH-ubiquinone oxidoreductase chain 4L n=1 Tax=Marmota marmota marmota TaxID=9994 RepID=A0A8C6AC40_MARMA
MSYHNYQNFYLYLKIFLAYITCLLGIFIYQSHLISSLLCLEGIILSIFVLCTLVIFNIHFSLSFIILFVLLVFAAYETAVGLALLVIVPNTYELNYGQNLNILQC